MTELPFSYLYPKLMHPVFPTLRRYDRFGSVGDVVRVRVKPLEYTAEAEVLAKSKRTWADMGEHFVTYDTATDTREGAEDHINQWYRNPIKDTEDLTLYTLKWMDHQRVIKHLTEEASVNVTP